MTKKELEKEAFNFRDAIKKAKEAGEFVPQQFKPERMNKFPHDCCDDATDLFIHYLFQKYGIDSIRIDGRYNDSVNGVCGHTWQETDNWIIDLTGDQFENDDSVPIKSGPVYVGKMDALHRQFKIVRRKHSCGIECLDDGSWDRMYDLYDKVMKYIK